MADRPNPFRKIQEFIASRRGGGPSPAPGTPHSVSGGHLDEDPEEYIPVYEYDEVQKETLAPELEKHGLSFPEDPNDPAYENLVADARKINPVLGVAVEQARQDTMLQTSGGFMAEQQRRSENANKPRELAYKYLYTANANGDPVLNKGLILGGIAALAVAAFFLAGGIKPGGGSAEASATVGTTVENADGSTTTTYPDGSVMTRAADGTETTTYPDQRVVVKDRNGRTTTTYPDKRVVVKEPDGSSTETLADGSVIHRDSSDQVIANLPPSQLDSALDTGTLIQRGTTPPAEDTTPTITGAAATGDPTTQEAGQIQPTTSTEVPMDTSSTVTTVPPSSDVSGSGTTGSDPAYVPDSGGTATTVSADPPYVADSGSTVAGLPDETSTLGSSGGVTPPSGSGAGSSGPLTLTPPASGAGQPSAVTVQSAQRLPAPTSRDLQSAGVNPVGGGNAGTVTRRSVTPNAPAPATRPAPTTTVMRGAGSTAGSTGGSAAPGNAAGGGGSVLAYRRSEPAPTQIMRVSGTAASGDAAPSSAPNSVGGSMGNPGSGGAGGSVVYRRTPPSVQDALASAPSTTNALPSTGLPDPSAAATDNTGLMPSSNTTTTPSSSPPAGSGGLPGGSEAAPGSPNAAGGPSTLPWGPYRTGQYLRARLETGAVLPAAQQSGTNSQDEGQYVYARTQDGTLWLGKPTISPTKRVAVSFRQAILRDGREIQVNATGYHLDGTPGLKANWQDITPTLANDLIRASLTGVRNYAEAKIQATTTSTLPNGTTVVQRQVPTIWESVAGSATGVFQLPETQNTFTTVARLNVGQDFVIVIAPGSLQDQ